MPDLARWADGPSIGPYVRVLPLARPVLTVLVDHRQAKLFRSQNGAFEEVWALDADQSWGDLSDNVNMSKRATTTTGVRGEADTDVANRLEQVAMERLLKSVVEVVGEHAGRDGLVIVGGPPETTAAALAQLPKALHERAMEEPTIDFRTRAAELARATEAAAAVLAAQLQERLVNQVVDLAGAGGRGCLGLQSTEKALQERRVELLLVSRALFESDPENLERSVVAAFEQAATVEEVVGAGADRLQRDGQGIAARLRYVT
jgi:stalled ribosome rescue protein Dom34